MKNEKTLNLKNKLSRFALISALIVGITVVPVAVFAASDNENTTINVEIGSTISVATSTTVSIGVTPVSGGAQTSAKDTVSVSTNNVLGYDLTLADSDATTSLVDGANTITAHAGTQAVPTALANNSWGYHVDSIGGFGTGGAVETNVTSSTIKYAGVPATGSPNNIKTSSTTASGEVTEVWYAAKVDTTKPNGTYSDTVTYTATTKV